MIVPMQRTASDRSSSASENSPSVVKRLFNNVAFWQGATFLMLICVIWINEILDLPMLIFGRQPASADWFGACILTAGILLVGIITVGHTYVQQQRILRGIIIVCSYCERVKIEETGWERIEEYLASKTKARFSHGICPECYGKTHNVPEACPSRDVTPPDSPVPPQTVVASARLACRSSEREAVVASPAGASS